MPTKEKIVLIIRGFFRTNLLTVLAVFGVLAGIAFGFILRAVKKDWSQREVVYVRFIGDLFLRMLKVLILPLIIASLVSAIGSLDLTTSGRIGVRATAFYMVTTFCAVFLGIILVIIIRPGTGGERNRELEGLKVRNVTTPDTLMDLIRNMLPPNIVQAMLEQYQTNVIYPGNDSIPRHKWKMSSQYQQGTNVLGLVVFATVLGICLGKMGEKGKSLVEFFSCLSTAMMILTNWVVWTSPIGVIFLIAGQILEQKDFAKLFANLGYYFCTVLAGLFIHGFIVLPAIYFIFTKTRPFKFIMNMTEALATAFGTASSSATLPITIRCLEDKNGVDHRVSRFVLPIGATINMDGTALYEAVAAIFIAQVVGYQLDLGQYIAISITSTAASIGAAGIPQAGLITMVMVLNTVGLPAEYIAYIIPVDWLLDRFRTTVNVLGDSIGAGIIALMSKKELEMLDEHITPKRSISTKDVESSEVPMTPEEPEQNEVSHPDLTSILSKAESRR